MGVEAIKEKEMEATLETKTLEKMSGTQMNASTTQYKRQKKEFLVQKILYTILAQRTKKTLKRSSLQEIVKLRAYIIQIQRKRLIKRINKTKSQFFEIINKIGKPLAKCTKNQRDSIQILKIRNEQWASTTDTEEIQRIIRSYFKRLYSIKLENLNK